MFLSGKKVIFRSKAYCHVWLNGKNLAQHQQSCHFVQGGGSEGKDVNDGGHFGRDVDHVLDVILIKVVKVKVKVRACWKVC